MTVLIEIKIIIIKILLIAINFLKIYSRDFIRFLLNKNIIYMAIGILISNQVVILTKTITDSIIGPILKKISFAQNELNNMKYNRLGIEFKMGQIISNLITFFMVLTIVFYIWNLTNATNLNFIDEFLNTIETNLNKSI